MCGGNRIGRVSLRAIQGLDSAAAHRPAPDRSRGRAVPPNGDDPRMLGPLGSPCGPQATAPADASSHLLMEPVVIVLRGAPTPKGRPRFVRKTGIAFQPRATATYESALRFAASAAMAGRAPIDQPVRVEIVASLPIPASWSQRKQQRASIGVLRPASRPDIDNIIKAATDACNAIVYRDDALIVELIGRKRYSIEPGVMICVTPL